MIVLYLYFVIVLYCINIQIGWEYVCEPNSLVT